MHDVVRVVHAVYRIVEFAGAGGSLTTCALTNVSYGCNIQDGKYQKLGRTTMPLMCRGVALWRRRQELDHLDGVLGWRHVALHLDVPEGRQGEEVGWV